MKYKTCSVFGHSTIEITKNLEDKLFETFENLIDSGYEYFYFGGFGMFDDVCWKIITELKQNYPHIKRIYCLSDPRHQNPLKRPRWMKDEDFEEFIYLDLAFDWWYQRIYFRNVEMINQSDFVIFYVNRTAKSGAYKTFQYAKKIKKPFINLGKDV